MRSPGGAGFAGGLGIGLAVLRRAGGRVGFRLIAAFAVGLAFRGDARRTGAFFAGLFLVVLAFLAVAVFFRVAALATGVFLRFALALPLAFFLVAIAASQLE